MRRLVLLTVTALALTAPPAHAETWRGADARGDVRALELTIDGVGCQIEDEVWARTDRRRDLTRLTVTHDRETVSVRLGLREVARRDPDTFVDVALRAPAADFLVGLSPGTRPSLLEVVGAGAGAGADGCGDTADEVSQRSCRGLRVDRDPEAGTVTLTVPRACLDDPGWVRAGVRASTAELVDPAQDRYRTVYDVWGRSGPRAFGVLPPVGPRVRVS